MVHNVFLSIGKKGPYLDDFCDEIFAERSIQ